MSSQTALEGARIILIDDDAAIRRAFRYCLEDAGYRVTSVACGQEAMTALERQVFDLAILDLRLGEESGLELLPQIRAAAPWMRVVMATADSSLDTAVDAMRNGAADYVVKPCSPDQLRFAVARQLEARRLEQRIRDLEQRTGGSDAADLETRSPAMARVLDEARRVADTDVSVLVLGESGTGKGVMARAIHGWSHRKARGFATINCPSLSAELLESELFGHRKGAFTGATESTEGRVSQADGGTLFLDEVGDFPMGLQPKLLRFVQDREYERVGDPVTRIADVRIVAATNRDLAAMVADGSFREDLLYRLNVITLRLPPLRERPEDIGDIALRFVHGFASTYGRPARGFSQAAEAALFAYPWPGNVRELRNVVERAVILSPNDEVGLEHLSIGHAAGPPSGSMRVEVGGAVSLEALERAHIAAVMAASPTLEQAARTLGIDSSTLYRKRKQFGLAG